MKVARQRTWKILAICWGVTCLLLCLAMPVSAQAVNATPAALNTAPQRVSLLESLQKSLATEQENMRQFQEKLNQAQWFEKDINAEFNAYKIEITAYNSVLLASETPVEELENIRANIRMAVEHVTARLKELHTEHSASEQARIKVKEQYTLNERQLQEIQSDKTTQDSSEPETQAILNNLHTLTALLSEKQQILERIQMLYAGMINKFEEIQHNFTTLTEKFSIQIEERKRQELFERRANPFSLLGWQQLEAEFNQVAQQGRLVLSKGFWRNTVQTLWKTEGFILFRFILFLAIAMYPVSYTHLTLPTKRIV